MSLLLVTSCSRSPDTHATLAAFSDTARDALAGEAEAVALVGANTLNDVQPELYAIAHYGAPGAFAYISDSSHLAVFISNGGKGAAGNAYYFVAWVNTSTMTLVNAGKELIGLGLDPSRLQTLENYTNALRTRGFIELTPANAPFVLATLRAALNFISTLGGATVDLIVAPVFPLTNPAWCPDGGCVGIQQ
jgi:hypothetical protein